MISSGEKPKRSKTLASRTKFEGQWNYLAVKKLSILREITSKHNGNFYFLNCFNSFRTKNKLEQHKRMRKKKDFCNVIVPSEGTKILEFNQ